MAAAAAMAAAAEAAHRGRGGRAHSRAASHRTPPSKSSSHVPSLKQQKQVLAVFKISKFWSNFWILYSTTTTTHSSNQPMDRWVKRSIDRSIDRTQPLNRTIDPSSNQNSSNCLWRNQHRQRTYEPYRTRRLLSLRKLQEWRLLTWQCGS